MPTALCHWFAVFRVPRSALRVPCSVVRVPSSAFVPQTCIFGVAFLRHQVSAPNRMDSFLLHSFLPSPLTANINVNKMTPSSNRSQIDIRNSHNKTSTKRPHTANMAPDNLGWPQIAPDSLRWLQMAPDGLRWPRMAPDGSDGLRSPYIRRLE